MSVSHKERSQLGSKREIRPGVWRVRVYQGYKADGGRRSTSATVRGTAAEADAKIVELAGEMGRSAYVGDDMTLDSYFDNYFMPTREASTTKANTYAYKSCYKKHIKPYLGGRQIGSITNLDIQRWVNGLPPQSAPNYVKTLRAVMTQAHFDHVITSNPMHDYRYKMPKGRRREPLPVWSAEQVGLAMGRLRGHRLYPLFLVMVGAGLSRSEALALDWDDVTWEQVTLLDGMEHWSAMVSITHACTLHDGMKEPKNDRRYRVVPLRPPFSDELHSCAGTGPIVQSVKLKEGGGTEPTGRRLSPRHVPHLWRECFDEGGPLHDVEGLPFVHLGRMRATYSTLMQRAGVDATIINAMQGRAEGSSVLYSNYLKPGGDTYAESADAMAKLVAG